MNQYYDGSRPEIDVHLPKSLGDVLEIGCGAGNTLRRLKNSHEIRSAIGFELDEASASRATQVFDEIRVGDIEKTIFDPVSKQFDTILALDVLEHLQDPLRVLKRLRSLMKQDGVLVLSLPNVANYSVSWNLFFHGQWNYADEGQLDRTHLRFFGEESAKALVADAGFKLMNTTYSIKTPNIFSFLGFRSDDARWRSMKICSMLLPRHMTISQFIIKACPV